MVNAYSSYATSLTVMKTHVPYGITYWYLPLGRGDIPALTLAN